MESEPVSLERVGDGYNIEREPVSLEKTLLVLKPWMNTPPGVEVAVGVTKGKLRDDAGIGRTETVVAKPGAPDVMSDNGAVVGKVGKPVSTGRVRQRLGSG